MTDFKQMLDDVERLAHKDVDSMVSFRDLLEDIAWLLTDLDNNTKQKTRTVDIVIVALLIHNLLLTAAIYLLIKTP